MSNNDEQTDAAEVEEELETENVELAVQHSTVVQDEEELPPEEETEVEVFDGGDAILTGEAEIADVVETVESVGDVDKVEDYFRQKGIIRTLRNDLKDHKLQMPQTEELEKLTKKLKELREEVKNDETVRSLTEKMATSKERMELLKELIRIELLESAQEEVKRNGRKLKLVNILREMKDEGKEKKEPNKKFFR